MTETKTFHIGDIISVTSGILVSPDLIGGVYDILGWMVGEDLMTHQLPRVSDECAPFLRETFPDLPSTVRELDGRDDWEKWVSETVAEHGATREVPRLPQVDHTHINPLTELRMGRPDAQIVVVEMGEKGNS